MVTYCMFCDWPFLALFGLGFVTFSRMPMTAILEIRAKSKHKLLLFWHWLAFIRPLLLKKNTTKSKPMRFFLPHTAKEYWISNKMVTFLHGQQILSWLFRSAKKGQIFVVCRQAGGGPKPVFMISLVEDFMHAFLQGVFSWVLSLVWSSCDKKPQGKLQGL